MPNHILNKVTICGTEREVAEVVQFLKNGEREIDFNNLIPMPQELDIEATGSKELNETQQANHLKYGFKDWYDWRIYYWGTKWNAYEVIIDGRHLEFQTAWSHPFPVIQELSYRFPDVSFAVEYADEDIGFNCGCYDIKNGEVEEYDLENPEQFASELWGIEEEELIDIES